MRRSKLTDPCIGPLAETKVSSVPSGSLSLRTTSISIENPATTLTLSAVATGGVFPSTVTVTIEENLPPVGVQDTAEVNAGQSVIIDVVSNDSDPEGTIVRVVSAINGSHGTTSLDRIAPAQLISEYSGVDMMQYPTIDDYVTMQYGGWDGYASMQEMYGTPVDVNQFKVKYTSTNSEYSGIDTFTYVVQDEQGIQSTVSVEVTVIGPTRVISATGATATEDGVFDFVISLDTAAMEEITVLASTVTGTATSGDYAEFSNQLVTFAVGETLKTVTVTVTNDSLVETQENFSLVLSDPRSNGVSDLSKVTFIDGTLDDMSAQGTINDNDMATLSIDDVSITEGDSGSSTLTFTATLSSLIANDVTFYADTQNGSATEADSDYVFTDRSFTITAGNTSQEISINVKGNR